MTRPGPAAQIFADDLRRAAEQAVDRLGVGEGTLILAITVPIDPTGLVVVSAAPPELTEPDHQRHPATLSVSLGPRRRVGRPSRRDRGWSMDLELRLGDGRILRIPGLEAGDPPGTAPLTSLAVRVEADGLRFRGTGSLGNSVELEPDEETARAVATALLITLGVKLTKADLGLEGLVGPPTSEDQR